MTELAAGVQPVFASPDGTAVWWSGSWVALDPRALSADRRWIMLAGQWRPIYAAPATSPTYAPAGAIPPGAAQQVLPVRPSAATPNQRRNRLLLAAGAVTCAAAVTVGIVWSQSSSSSHSGTTVSARGYGSGTSPQSDTSGYEAAMKSDLRTVAQDIEADNVDLQDYTQVTFGRGAGLPNTSIAGPDQPVGVEKATLSPGDTVTLETVSTTSYCLKATSDNTAKVWYYDSARGGITQTAC